ncbi:helix-turn-helix domain-containing protein [Streptomyces sp. NRRL S-237]|uniref:helix-turn-helix domain-containing protein n=1 Tax=Streptomyces sp. NRRL S-237 TaxID=1463895 RepID=UPI000B248533
MIWWGCADLVAGRAGGCALASGVRAGGEAGPGRGCGRVQGVGQGRGRGGRWQGRAAVPCARSLGLSGQLWTRGPIGELIFRQYRIRFTETGVGKYLKRWGLTFQRPDKRAVEQDAEAVRVWHEETWPAIRARAKAERGEVLFADQVGVRSDQVTGCTWGAKVRRRSSAAPGTGYP